LHGAAKDAIRKLPKVFNLQLPHLEELGVYWQSIEVRKVPSSSGAGKASDTPAIRKLQIILQSTQKSWSESSRVLPPCVIGTSLGRVTYRVMACTPRTSLKNPHVQCE
jgi:hypothetical protein